MTTIRADVCDAAEWAEAVEGTPRCRIMAWSPWWVLLRLLTALLPLILPLPVVLHLCRHVRLRWKYHQSTRRSVDARSGRRGLPSREWQLRGEGSFRLFNIRRYSLQYIGSFLHLARNDSDAFVIGAGIVGEPGEATASATRSSDAD